MGYKFDKIIKSLLCQTTSPLSSSGLWESVRAWRAVFGFSAKTLESFRAKSLQSEQDGEKW